MSRFKRIKEWKTFRYYQEDSYGIFVDVERHHSKVKVYMGSLCGTIDRGTIPPIVEMGKIDSDLLCYLDNRNSIALKTFENIYNEFLNEYSIEYLINEYSAVENWDGKIGTDDVSEFKAIKYRNKNFQVEFMTVLNPRKEDNTITYVYIFDKKSYYKVLCDFFDYELPEDKYEETLEENIKEYIADFYCEVAGKPYEVVGHHKKDDLYKEEASEDKGSPIGETLENHMGGFEETIQALPFC